MTTKEKPASPGLSDQRLRDIEAGALKVLTAGVLPQSGSVEVSVRVLRQDMEDLLELVAAVRQLRKQLTRVPEGE